MQKRIVVIDDDEAIRDVVHVVLESTGFEVITTPLFDKDYFSKSVPDLLLDISLAGIDGRKICRQLKQDPHTKHMPIIILSAHSQEEV